MPLFRKRDRAIPDDWRLSRVLTATGTVRGYMRKRMIPRRAVPKPGHDLSAWVTLYFEPMPNGMPKSEDMDLLGAFEQRLTEDIEGKDLAIMVGAALLDGKRDFLFYLRDRDSFLEALWPLMDGLSEFKPSVSISPDPEWDVWREMIG